MIENFKEKAIERIKQRCKLSERYNEGLMDGFIEGYEAALKDTQVIITKYNLGKEPTETTSTLRPAKRFLRQPIGEMIDKVVEECDEVVEAYNDGHPHEHLAEELADVQEACETALAKMGFNREERQKIRKRVLLKNASRGYYAEADGND
jgi:phosphoribosyl-ATP pyrophosphohydrolase